MRGVYFSNGKIELRDAAGPSGDGVRVRVRAAGICGSDLHMMEINFPLKYIMGHEAAGLLDDGTPVAVEPVSPCGECELCRRGDYNLCRDATASLLGVGCDGCMVDEMQVAQRCVVPLPSNADIKDGCLVEPLSVALHGMRKAGLKPDQRVAVIGAGAIGLCAVAVASDAGAEVGLVSRYEHQSLAGKRLCAAPVEGKYDLVAECTGSKDAVKQAVDLCRPGGRVLLLGTYWEGVPLSMAVMLKEITVVSSYMYSSCGGVRDFEAAAGLLSRRPEIAGTLITHRFPLSEAKQAFAVARDRKSGAIKVVLEP